MIPVCVCVCVCGWGGEVKGTVKFKLIQL